MSYLSWTVLLSREKGTACFLPDLPWQLTSSYRLEYHHIFGLTKLIAFRTQRKTRYLNSHYVTKEAYARSYRHLYGER